MDLVVRRALLRHAANLAGQEFDPEAFGIERERFKFSIGSSARISVGSKYWVGIRAMGALG